MTLYDAFGREVDVSRLQEEQAAPTMSGVRNIYSSMHPSAGLTPERLTQILREAEFGDPFLYLELAEEMEEKDLHYLAVLNTRTEAVAQLDLEGQSVGTRPHRVLEQAIRIPTLGFRAVHREIRMLEQRRGISAVLGKAADSDAAGGVHGPTGE